MVFSEEISLVSPLLIPETVVANESPVTLAKALIRRLEKGNIEQGEYLEMLRHAPNFSLQHDLLVISLQAPRKHSLYPNLELEFSYFYTQLPNQYYLGFIPVLGIEGYAETTKELVTVLQRAIELEFSRKKRLTDVRRIITTQWYEEIDAEQHLIETRFHTLSELANLHEFQSHRWLPKIAKLLTPLPQQRCFGREKELEQLLRTLTGKYSRSVLLVGRAGVGKTALIKEIYRMGAKKGLGTVKFWETTAARLLQKLTVESGWEEAFGQVLEELSKCGDILYVRNLAQLFEVGAYVGNPISMAEFMREHIALGSVRIITECSDEELATLDTRAPGYTNLFQILRIEPPPTAQQPDIVSHRLRVAYPEQEIPSQAIKETLQLQHRYALYSGFPGKTVRFLESILNQENRENKNVPLNREEVITRFCEESGMPRFLVDSRTNLELDETRKFFQARLFGQDSAINTVVNLLASIKTRLTRPGKPIASLLFVGPTGVGKTELAKALTEFMFGDSERLIRFDMSEFSDEIAVLRLTGDISRGQGLLTDKIRQQPFSVVLFDELEKAHFVFYDLLLQIMGEGRLTDARGQVADFCSSVIIMTSNIGAGVSKQRSPGFHKINRGHHALHQHYLHAVQRFFRPELFNRLDQVIPFNALDLNVLRPIVYREINKIKARDGLRTRNVTLQVEDAVVDYLAKMSGDIHYGARQLQRCLHEQVVIPLATTLNHYSFSTSMKVFVQVGKTGLIFKTMIYTQKARTDQMLTDTKWTLRELSFKATEARRLAQRINDGPPMNQLWSKWDILERRRRRNGKKFWQDSLITHEYGILHNLLEDAKTLLKKVETIEIDCSLAFVGINNDTDGLIQTLLDWKKQHGTWQTHLLNTVQPETGRCMLSVYGAADCLHEIINIFNRLAEVHGWIITERAVWLRSNRKKYIYTNHPNSPNRSEDKLIGRELQMVGPGVALFLINQGGVHVWIDREEKQYPYAVIITQCVMSKFKTPKDVHRKKFLDNMEIKRHYWKSGFFDFGIPTTHTGSSWPSILEKQLNDAFKKRLKEVLYGEEPEVDLSLPDDDLLFDQDVPF
ncbi:AAA family ATPase [Candidatus Parabeggiatoa sp. HSG14]|uniref:AAA family ATPase n=1 Tax=Candidatus Parabeggiatoa sp. HSG14 TaxID=3055593 RepID=UPI0025A8D425|nr:AAA family ATPase [Thiotrichales bacterium HSG14]